MMHTKNGAPIWCPPAPTRSGELRAPTQPAEKLDLSEIPGIVARAIAAGLIKRGEPEPVKCRKNQREDICTKCGVRFWQSRSQKVRTCTTCRIPAKPCVVCGKTFHAAQRKYLTCSETCAQAKRQAGLRAYLAERWEAAPKIECPICGKIVVARKSGGKFNKTCGQQCGAELFRRNHAARRQQQQPK